MEAPASPVSNFTSRVRQFFVRKPRPAPKCGARHPRLLDRVRHAIRVRHCDVAGTICFDIGVMRHTTLLSFVVIAAFTGCGRQTTTTTTPPKAGTMNCTLDICGAKQIQDPTESDIREAVFALDTKKGDAFLILGPTEMTYIQIGGDQKVGFVLEHQDTDAKHHYRAKRNLTADDIVKALVIYSTGADDWKTMAEWELVKW